MSMTASGASATPAFDMPALDTRRFVIAGVLGLALLVGVFGAWAGLTQIGGAIISQGQTAALGRSKTVQHPDGGTVASIQIANGDHVEAGQILLTLDPTLVALNLDISRSRLAAALALRARLEAEQSGAADIAMPVLTLPDAVTRVPLGLDTEIVAQRDIFTARAAVLAGDRAQLVETLAQFDEQIAGTEGQIAAIDVEGGYLADEIATQQELLAQGLARQSALSEILRQQAGIAGRRAALSAEIARLQTAKRDAEIATEQTVRGFHEQVVTDLRETVGSIEELILEIVTRQGELDRMQVRAPAAGIVHELQVTTVGGVVAPGATILEIVPQNGTMEFEIRVDPGAIDQVHVGQEAEIVLAGFDRQTTPEIKARIATISAAAVEGQQNERPFYRVVLSVPAGQLTDPAFAGLIPGMPIEAYLATGDRSVLSYLLSPMTSHLRHMFRQ